MSNLRQLCIGDFSEFAMDHRLHYSCLVSTVVAMLLTKAMHRSGTVNFYIGITDYDRFRFPGGQTSRR